MKLRVGITLSSVIALSMIWLSCAAAGQKFPQGNNVADKSGPAESAPPNNIHYHYVPQFLPELSDSVAPITFRVVLIQEDPFVAVHQTSPLLVNFIGTSVADPLATLFETAIAEGGTAIANKIRRNSASNMNAQLAGHGFTTSVIRDFEPSLSSDIITSPWLHTAPLEVVRDKQQLKLPEENQPHVAILELTYFLTYDASALIMQAHLSYFRSSQNYSAYNRNYTYYSATLGQERGKDAVEKWMASDQDLLHRCVKEGIGEIIKMIDRDFVHPEYRDPSEPALTFSCYDAPTANSGQCEGYVLRKINSRILFKKKDNGDYFSVLADDGSTTVRPISTKGLR